MKLDKTFWERLSIFVENVNVNDMPSNEEKEMILAVCRNEIKQQWLSRHESETNPSPTEIEEAERLAFHAARERVQYDASAGATVDWMENIYKDFEAYKSSKTSKK